jgi:hypothetical protein
MFRTLILVLLVTFPLGIEVAPGLASVNAQRVGIESVNDWRIEVDVDEPNPVECLRPTSTQDGDTVTTTIPCRTYSGARIPKRGIVVEALVELRYQQSGEFIDDCEARKSSRNVAGSTCSARPRSALRRRSHWSSAGRAASSLAHSCCQAASSLSRRHSTEALTTTTPLTSKSTRILVTPTTSPTAADRFRAVPN